MDKPESFGVFCKVCGTYDVDLFVSIHYEIVFECKNNECSTTEIFTKG
jgi:hypothetical protein